ncbi:MAG TPA: hypothetical protein PLO65_08150, partial [Caulobacter sp.]|nr:hypothetical protein [Caulobacter sp.]
LIFSVVMDVAGAAVIAGPHGFEDLCARRTLRMLGDRLAASLGVAPGDSVTLISPAGSSTAFGTSVTQKDYTIGGIFSVG